MGSRESIRLAFFSIIVSGTEYDCILSLHSFLCFQEVYKNTSPLELRSISSFHDSLEINLFGVLLSTFLFYPCYNPYLFESSSSHKSASYHGVSVKSFTLHHGRSILNHLRTRGSTVPSYRQKPQPSFR